MCESTKFTLTPPPPLFTHGQNYELKRILHATMLIIRNDAAEIELYHADDSLVPDNNTLSDNDGHIYKKGDAVYHFHFSFQMWCLQMYFSLFLF